MAFVIFNPVEHVTYRASWSLNLKIVSKLADFVARILFIGCKDLFSEMVIPISPFKASLTPTLFKLYRKHLYSKCKATDYLSQAEVVHEEAKKQLLEVTDKFRKNSFYFDPGEQLVIKVRNYEIRNPVALAAGFDKDCEVLQPLSYVFGIISPGSVVKDPRYGNPQPRVEVDEKREAIINAQGYPHKGLDCTVENLKKFHNGHKGNAKILLSFSGITEVCTEDAVLESCKEIIVRTSPYVDFGFEENRSSPNTDFNEVLQTPEFTKKIMDVMNTHAPGKVKSSKIPPYSQLLPSEEERKSKLQLIKAFYENGGEIVVINNTRPINTRTNPLTKNFVRPVAGESGRPLLQYTLKLIEDMRKGFPDLTIIACGGIFSGGDAWLAYQRGATLVSLYTALTFRGFGVVREIQDTLKRKLGNETLQSYIERRDASLR